MQTSQYFSLESKDNYDNILYHDELGYTSASMSYGQTTEYMANVFTITTGEAIQSLKAISVYTKTPGTIYKIYANTIINPDAPFAGGGTMLDIAAGDPEQLTVTENYAGYHTIPFTNQPNLNIGDSFIIRISVTKPSPDSQALTFETATNPDDNITINPGESFFSYNGSSWTDLSTVNGAGNFNIRAFTGEAKDTIGLDGKQRTEYEVGDQLDLGYGSIEYFEKGVSQGLIPLSDPEISVTGFGSGQSGTYRVTVNYKGAKTEYSAVVRSKGSPRNSWISIDKNGINPYSPFGGSWDVNIVSWVPNAGNDGGTLTLNNLNLNTVGSQCIEFKDELNGDIIINLIGTNTLKVDNTINGVGISASPNTSGKLTITGSGTLNITSRAFCIEGDHDVVIGGDAKLNLTTTEKRNGFSVEGLLARHNSTITDRAVVTASGLGSGIRSDNVVTINGDAQVTATGEKSAGIICYRSVVIGDNAKVIASGAAIGIWAGMNGSYEGDPPLTISGNAVVNAEGGNYGICSTDDLIIGDTTHVTAKGGLYGIHSIRNITVHDAILRTIGGTGGIFVGGTNTYADSIIYENDIATVYGDVTISDDLTILPGETLNIPRGSTLTIPGGVTLTNEGIIVNDGKIENGGNIENDGDIDNDGDGSIENTGGGSFFGNTPTGTPPIVNFTATVSINPIPGTVYDGKAKTPVLTVKYGGNTLVKDTDYTVSNWANNINAGTASVTIIGKGNYSGTKTATFSIAKANIGALNIAAMADKSWTGKKLVPIPTVKHGSIVLKNGTHFTVSHGANKNIGKGTITINAKNANYTGSITRAFKIVPKKTSVSKAVTGKKQVKVTWKKVSAAQKVTKYEIRYRVKGTEAWKTKSASAKSSSLTIKQLKKGKAYQIQVRSYKTVSGVKYHSAWSSTKTSGKVK
jgi:hypothetical protein